MKIFKTILFIGIFAMFNCSGTRPTDLGVREGKLKPCPSSPNCISSQADPTDEKHYFAPFSYQEDSATELKKVRELISSMPRTKIIKEETNYIYAEFASRLMGFVDDVEFYFDDSAKQIHFRSASRLGKGDLGVNKKRIMEIKEKLKK
jgi:uncharacterized protein (DUF1499 family)